MIVLLFGLKFLYAQGLFERQIVYKVAGMENVKAHKNVICKSVEAKKNISKCNRAITERKKPE
jgi:hypothetical protein